MTTEHLIHDVHWDVDYKIHVGEAWSRFFHGLRNQTILGSTCSSCDRTYVPPQSFCESCHESIDDWSEIAPTGTLHAATIVYRGFKGGPTAPYAVGAIQLDGTDSLLMHFVGAIDFDDADAARSQLHRGLRLEAVWEDERTGTILDIRHFVPTT